MANNFHFSTSAFLTLLFQPLAPLARNTRKLGEDINRRSWRYEILKRLIDIGFCLLALPVALPLSLLCALAIKASSRGPVLFRQHRTGRGGKPFKMLKFRTMVTDAEARKDSLRPQVHSRGPDFKLVDDPRITAIGSLLRRSSLDELPQLWNVLRGDMTLVGPRPTSFGVETYAPWHAERLEVKPGLTGLWQVTARGDTDFDRRVRLDVAYVRNRSLWLDIHILVRTLPAVLLRRGAY